EGFLIGLHEIRTVHDGDPGHIVAETCRVRVLTDIGALADLLDDILLHAKLGTVEDFDGEPSIGPLLDALGPFEEALMEGLARSHTVNEAKGVCLLCLGGAMRERKGRGGAGGRKHSSQSVHVFSSLFNSPTPPAGDDDQRPAYASPFPGSPTPYPSARRRKAS